MKTFKLFGRYVKKYWAMFIVTVLLVVGLNYIRSIIPKLTSAFVAIVEGKPLIESEIPSFLLPFFNSYYVFCIWRALSGAAVTSILPLYLSILSDMFPLKTRTVASVIVTTVTCMGTLIGQTVSSFFATRYGWRFFFRLISSMGIISTISLICICLIHFVNDVVMKYPRKGESDMAATTPIEKIKNEDLEKFKLDISVLTDSLSVPTNWISTFASLF